MFDSDSPFSLPPESPPVACAVSEFVARARGVVEGEMKPLWVSGEIANFTRAASGHWYFVLRDDRAQVDCVMLARFAAAANPPRNGDRAEVFGKPTVYEPRGRFQIAAQFLRAAGEGRLHQIFMERKKALAARGWFDAARKRPLPLWPRRVGVVCSPSGAALRDVLKTARARMPGVPIVIYPAPAQGADAAMKIAAAIRTAGQRGECDALVVCRGGGGMEELQAYNEEVVVAAIVESPAPVVCGIGHETDETLADFAADVRAATPTAAAAMVFPDREELRRECVLRIRNLHREANRRWDEFAQRADFAARGLSRPEFARSEKARAFATAAAALLSAAESALARNRNRAKGLAARVHACAPDAAVSAAEAELKTAEQALSSAVSAAMRSALAKTESAARTIAALNPQLVLRRGFSVVRDSSGAIVSDSSGLKTGDSLRLEFAKGGAEAEVRGKF